MPPGPEVRRQHPSFPVCLELPESLYDAVDAVSRQPEDYIHAPSLYRFDEDIRRVHLYVDLSTEGTFQRGSVG
jgi:hypothetical protein